MRLYIWGRAHLPEHGEHEGDDRQAAHHENPKDIQHIREAHKDGTGNTAADARPPRPVDLVARRPGGQKAHEQDQEAKRSHHRANDNYGRLDPLNPQEAQIEHPVQHDDRQAGAAVHRTTEDHHSDQAHNGGH